PDRRRRRGPAARRRVGAVARRPRPDAPGGLPAGAGDHAAGQRPGVPALRAARLPRRLRAERLPFLAGRLTAWGGFMAELELSVVVPVYRSAGTLPVLLLRLRAALVALGVPYEIILVDDGSPDDSWEVMRRLQA